VPNTVRIYSCLTLFFGRRKIVCWFNKSIEFRLKLEICSKNRFHSGQIRILFKHPARLKNLDTIVNKILIIFAFKRTIKALILTITPKKLLLYCCLYSQRSTIMEEIQEDMYPPPWKKNTEELQGVPSTAIYTLGFIAFHWQIEPRKRVRNKPMVMALNHTA
jgi:hypothetical protein